jgi:hypothetical protein
VEYNRDQDGNWNVPKQRFLQDPQQAAYPAGSAPHLHSAIDVRSTNAIATAAQPNSDSAPFIHFSPGDITPKALKTHKRIGDKESAPKRPRANPLPQGASNDSAGNMNSAAIWDGSAVGEQNGTFGTAQIPLFPGSGQLPLERYASGMSAKIRLWTSLTQFCRQQLQPDTKLFSRRLHSMGACRLGIKYIRF